jgi:hypothetical protein
VTGLVLPVAAELGSGLVLVGSIVVFSRFLFSVFYSLIAIAPCPSQGRSRSFSPLESYHMICRKNIPQRNEGVVNPFENAMVSHPRNPTAANSFLPLP